MSQSKAAYTTMDCKSLVFEKNNNMATIVELIYIVAMVNIAAGLQLRSGKIWMGDLGATVPPIEKMCVYFLRTTTCLGRPSEFFHTGSFRPAAIVNITLFIVHTLLYSSVIKFEQISL